MGKQYLWAKGICLARGKAWGEDRLYCRREIFYSKRISENQELESPTVYGGEYVKTHLLIANS
jgi:hypothetical protein